MNKQQREAHEQKQKELRKLREQLQEIMQRGPDPNYPVNKLSIEEQIALGIPLSTGWVATMPLPGRGRAPKKTGKS